MERKNRNKSDFGPNFVAPDGGWGWAVCAASGFSFFCTLPVLVQFGLIFRDHLLYLGLTNTEITTLINVHSAVSSCSGLFNGPMFRALSFRQVACLGSILITIGLFSASFSNSFITYLLTFSILYGFGFGMNLSASTLVVYTYFKEKRSLASGIQWTISGLGPVVMPYIAAFLIPAFGVQGSVIIFSGIALHAMICGTIYQPVLRHVRKHDNLKSTEEQGIALMKICEHCKTAVPKSASQHLYKSDDKEVPTTKSHNHTYVSISPTKSNDEIVDSFTDTKSDKLKQSLADDDCKNLKEENGTWQQIQKCICASEREALLDEINRNVVKSIEDTEPKKSLSFHQKIVGFFDLDLLKDFTYLNLMVGLTTANFAEMNYTILTPFILRDYGFDSTQIANTMAILAVTDISMRMVIPFIVSRIGWQNKTFFLVGVIAIAFGRIVVAHSRNYYTVLAVSAWIGVGRALNIIFMFLVIPSHVSLDRLPAASGLMLLFKGIFAIAAGPLVGKIRDASNYTVTLHCLNIAAFWTVLSWWLEDIYRLRKKNATTKRSTS